MQQNLTSDQILNYKKRLRRLHINNIFDNLRTDSLKLDLFDDNWLGQHFGRK